MRKIIFEDGDGERVTLEGDFVQIGEGRDSIYVESILSKIKTKDGQFYEHPLTVEESVFLENSNDEEMLDKLCLKPIISKTRYKINYQGKIWELDIFDLENETE